MQKTIRVIALVAVFGLIFAALIFSSVKPANVEENLWNEAMVLGDPATATRHYVVYTDLMCPYCNYYAKAVADHDAEFQAYLAEHHIAYEVRMTDMLYESSGVELSLPAGEAAYCAARSGKFWEFYHLAVNSLFEDYYVRGIGNSKTAPKISDIDESYWLAMGEELGLGESFANCFTNGETFQELRENTYRAATVANGLPYFVFNKYITGGFDSTWGWSEVETMLNAGLRG